MMVAAKTGVDHPIIRKRVANLKPSPENERIYDRNGLIDPDTIALAESIKKNGCLPLVVTKDNYIVSGHRRRLALLWNKQDFVRCQVLPVSRDAMGKDGYIRLLREHNHQRHKSAAEEIREELIDLNPDDVQADLLMHRHKSVNAAERNGVEFVESEGTKKRYGISADKAEHVKYIKKVVFEDRKAYWPLSVRGVHYALLNYEFLRNISEKLPYQNDSNSYQATSNLITRLRLKNNGELPWEAFDDPTRPFKRPNVSRNVREYIRQEHEWLYDGYQRDLLQTQPNYVEVVCEKNTVYHMALQVAKEYQIPTSSGRGFNSIDPWYDLKKRYLASKKKLLFVIVLSDYDPEGERIPIVALETLRDDFGLSPKIIKAGVTRKQIEEYDLPAQSFAKDSSSNYAWFLERNDDDDTVWELEALDPEDMMADLEEVIKNVIDVDMFNREVEIQEEEGEELVDIKAKALE
jgi:hypothetical protein